MPPTGKTMRGERAPLLIADRGASAAAPEHTIAAFERAVDEGADGLWLDVHCSRDHHPVVIRDFTLERTTDGAGPVGDHDLRALKRLDAGGWRGAAFAGQRIQTLEEVLERFRLRTRFVLALRGGVACYPEMAERVMALADIYGVIERSLVVSFDHAALAVLRQGIPDLPLGYLLAGARIDGIPAGVRTVGLEAYHLAAPTLATLAAAGTDCYGLSVSEPAAAQRLAALGLTGIVTDRPGPIVARLGR